MICFPFMSKIWCIIPTWFTGKRQLVTFSVNSSKNNEPQSAYNWCWILFPVTSLKPNAFKSKFSRRLDIKLLKRLIFLQKPLSSHNDFHVIQFHCWCRIYYMNMQWQYCLSSSAVTTLLVWNYMQQQLRICRRKLENIESNRIITKDHSIYLHYNIYNVITLSYHKYICFNLQKLSDRLYYKIASVH